MRRVVTLRQPGTVTVLPLSDALTSPPSAHKRGMQTGCHKRVHHRHFARSLVVARSSLYALMVRPSAAPRDSSLVPPRLAEYLPFLVRRAKRMKVYYLLFIQPRPFIHSETDQRATK